MMTNEQAERTALTLVCFFSQVDDAPSVADRARHESQLFAIRDYIRLVFGVDTDVCHIISCPRGGYYRDFHGEEVELTYQANVAFRLPGEDDILAEAAVGYGADGFTYCEVAYY